MSAFRKDPFGPTWVLISPERGLEASDFGSLPQPQPESPLAASVRQRDGDPFRVIVQRPAEPPEPDRWEMQVLEPPSTLVRPRSERPEAPAAQGPFESVPASGRQELIVEHPRADVDLHTMPLTHLTDVLKLYRERIELHGRRDDVRHVQITRSVGRAAGAIYDHPHASLLAVPVPNRWIEEERTAAAAHHAEHGRCLFCDVAEAELRGRARLVTHNAAFVAFTPYASRAPFEVWIQPRRHEACFGRTPSNALPELAALLQTVVRAIADALDAPPFNVLLHTLPDGGDDAYHWHMEIHPRLTAHAGFDWGSGFYVNPTPPEDAARFLREAIALHDVTL